MTKDDQKNNKVSYTLRLNSEINERIAKEASELGLSKQAYITMVLHKAIKNV